MSTTSLVPIAEVRRKVYQDDHYAGFGARAWANVIDGFVLGVLFRAVSAISPEVADWFGVIAVPLYQIGLKAARGTTLGYHMMDIRLVSITGKNPTINQVAVRQISAIFSFLALGLGYLWIAFDREKQSWHDKIAGTYVVLELAEPSGMAELSSRSPMKLGVFACQVVFLGGLGFTIYQWVSGLMEEGLSHTDPAVVEFHQHYNAGEDSAIFDATDIRLRRSVDTSDIVALLGEVRTKLGKQLDLSFACADFTRRGSESIIRVEYRALFENGEAWETYDWSFDGEQTCLLAYAVETGFADGKPDWEAALAPTDIHPNETSCTGEGQATHWWEAGQ